MKRCHSPKKMLALSFWKKLGDIAVSFGYNCPLTVSERHKEYLLTMSLSEHEG